MSPKPGLVEKEVPAWVIQKAASLALDEKVRGIENRNADTYHVMVERENDE